MDKLVLKPINDLLSQSFTIPSYQRGYRWKKEQVTNLLDDIWNFRLNSENETKEVFYCLQPVVVSKKNEEWILIDGQQRFTTIFIIMQCLKKQMDALDKNKYSISYDTRVNSKTFLENLSSDSLTNRDDNVDFYHICEAYDAVINWFNGKDGNTKIHLLTTLLNDNESGKNVKVIWYDVSDESTTEKFAIDIFTRLNIGKIPLTNAELVKALFLMKSNFEEQGNLRKIQIATEWDIIEKKLQDNSFWYFIYSPKNSIKYENRIEYIFDLLKHKKRDYEEYYTFNEFLFQFENSKNVEGKINIDKIWLEIKQYFLTLEEWYSDRDLYHLVGYLIEYEINIDELKEKANTVTKTEFQDYLKNKIKKLLSNINIDTLDYNSNKKEIKKVLLLLNIQTILSTVKGEIRFPFNKYKQDRWDIEHVNSQTEKTVDANSRKYWAIDLLEYFTGQKGFSNNIIHPENGQTEAEIQKEFVANLSDEDKYKDYCKKLIVILESNKVEEEYFNNLYNDLRKEFEEEKIKNKDDIYNLTLLDESTNRSYGNAMFPIKRKRIIENDMNGIFIPICTKNLFLKYYSKQMKDVMYWQEKDAVDYKNAIVEILKDYLPQNNKK